MKNPADYAHELLKGARKVDDLQRDLHDTEHRLIEISRNIKSEAVNELSSRLEESLNINLTTNVNLEYLYYKSNNSKKQILVTGYYGASNFGDEVMLQEMLKKLIDNPEIRRNYEITVMIVNMPGYDLSEYPGVKVIHYPKSSIDMNYLAYTYDVLVVGGGCLIENTNYDVYYKEFAPDYTIVNLSLRMKSFDKTVIWYGLSSTSKLDNEEYIERLRRAVSEIDYISLRDVNSVKTLKEYGVVTDKIKIVDDIAMADELLIKRKMDKVVNKVGLIYMGIPEQYEKLKGFTRKLLDWTKNEKTQLVCIPFCEPYDLDSKFYEKLMSEINSSRITKVNLPKNLEDFYQIIDGMKVIISMKYHGTMFANFAGYNVINLMNDEHPHYENKMRYLYDNYGFENKKILISKLDQIDKKQWEKLIRVKNKKSGVNLEEVCRRANDSIEKMIKYEILGK